MAHFLLYFRFSGFRSSFFPLFQPIFSAFRRFGAGAAFFSRFSFLLSPTYGAFPAGGTPGLYPVRFMLFSFSLRPSAPSPAKPDFPARHFPGMYRKAAPLASLRLFFSSPPALVFPEKARPLPHACRMPAPARSFARRRDFPGGPTVYTAPRPIPF